MDGEATALQSLNIYLTKEDVHELDGAIKSGGLTRIDLSRRLGVPALLFIKRPRGHAPEWVRFFDGVVEPDEFGRVSSSAAVAVLQIGERILCVSFGHGRFLLDQQKVEDRFGLKVCLNSIDEQAIRSIDKRSFDALLTQSRVQTSKAAPIGDYGLDIEQDLLRAATGKPRDPELGERISGLDSLTVTVRAQLGQMPALLTRYLQALRSTRYRRIFPWVDQITEVTGASDIEELDRALAKDLGLDKSKRRSWMALPDVVDWTHVHGFRFSARQKAPLRYDIHVDEWLEDIGEGLTISPKLLKRRMVFASDMNGHDVDVWPVYKCLYCEIEDAASTYLLSGGKWYKVKRDLVVQVNETYARIPRRAPPLPRYEHDSEGDYNEGVAAAAPAEYSCHDKKLIRVPSSGSPIEVCDLYSRRGEFIHVKRYAASSVLSHHFAQALVSAEVLSLDEAARDAFAAQVAAPFQFTARPFQPASHTAVLAIVSDQEGDLVLPFFSRLNLRHAQRRLRAMGYNVALAKIDVEDRVRVRKRHVGR